MLSYESTGRVRDGIRRVLQADAAQIQRDWWRGGLGFEPGAATLRGSTPLFHRSRLIPDPDDLFMAFCDVAFLTGRLSDWAARHRLKWRLHMHDEDWGAIDPGGPDEVLSRSMNKWARRVQVVIEGRGEYAIPEDRRRDLLARHAGRRI